MQTNFFNEIEKPAAMQRDIFGGEQVHGITVLERETIKDPDPEAEEEYYTLELWHDPQRAGHQYAFKFCYCEHTVALTFCKTEKKARTEYENIKKSITK